MADGDLVGITFNDSTLTPRTVYYRQVGASAFIPAFEGGVSRQSSCAFTRATGALTYTANRAMSDHASTPTVLTFPNCARVNGGGGAIIGVRAVDAANQTLLPDLSLYLFTVAPAAKNDNATFDPSFAEMAYWVATARFSSWNIGNTGAGASGNAWSLADAYGPGGFQCAAASKSLYGLLKVKNAYVALSLEQWLFILDIQQD